jgi:hypothetical protein
MVAVAYLIRAVVKLARPRLRAASATPDLLDTPPAVVNLLAHGFTGAPEAAAATLLDLAARGYVALEQPGNDPAETVVRVLRTDRAGLTNYEGRVLKRVARPPGAAPPSLADLTRRHADDGQEWAKRLEGEVRADAERRGLVRTDGISLGMKLTIAGIGFGVLLACLCGPAAVTAVAPVANVLSTDVGGFLALCAMFVGALIFVFVLVGVVGEVPEEQHTDLGRRTARHWGSVRRWLLGHEAFGELPPAAVTVWERYLAYGVALAAAPVAAATIDLRVGRVDLVASSYGGQPHLVRVRYPRQGGLRGARAGLRMLLAAASLSLLALLWWSLREQFAALPLYGRAAIGGVAAFLVARWLYRLVRGAGDLLTAGRRLTGQVVRIVPFGTFGDASSTLFLDLWYDSKFMGPLVRRFGRPTMTADGTGLVPGFYAVVDDGRSETVKAWLVHPKLAATVRTGDVIRAQAQRWSGHLTRIVQSSAGTAG